MKEVNDKLQCPKCLGNCEINPCDKCGGLGWINVQEVIEEEGFNKLKDDRTNGY
jgi:DnaJ-class molecular chaperone